MEDLSYAYVHAVSAAAGYSCAKLGNHDTISIDARLSPYDSLVGEPGRINPILHLQLKSTRVHDFNSHGVLSLQLSNKNYNELSIEDGSNKLLVLLVLPENPREWIVHTKDELISRRCAYWLNLTGSPLVDTDKSVHFDKQQVFSVNFLISTMDKISRRLPI